MARIRLSTDEIGFMTLFESMTGATVRDVIQAEDGLGILIKRGDMGLAIGRKGANIERMRKAVGKGVWVMESSDEPKSFIKNLFKPVRIKKIKLEEDGNIAVVEISKRDRGKVLGHDGARIRIARELAKRHFRIQDITIHAT